MTKHYVIVGGSKGIGLQLTRQLVGQNHEVSVLSRTNENLAIRGASHYPYDVTDPEAAIPSFDSIDGLAYLPGTIHLKPFHRLNQEDFLKDLQVNLLGGIKVIQELLPALKKGTDPSIVLFSTVAVQQGMSFHSSVAASKGAIEGLTRSLAAEFAPTVRVNCLAPSITDTPLASRLLSSDEKKEAAGKRHALQRVGKAEDIAHTAAFLLSDHSSWMTGQVLGVDGGMSTLR